MTLRFDDPFVLPFAVPFVFPFVFDPLTRPFLPLVIPLAVPLVAPLALWPLAFLLWPFCDMSLEVVEVAIDVAVEVRGRT